MRSEILYQVIVQNGDGTSRTSPLMSEERYLEACGRIAKTGALFNVRVVVQEQEPGPRWARGGIWDRN